MRLFIIILILVQVNFFYSQNISAGSGFTLFLCENNTVKGVGGNSNGQLGIGTNTNINVPQTIPGLNDVIAVSAGSFHSLFLKSDGTVWASGKNDKGQLGDGTTIDKNIPTQVVGISGVIAISGGNRHSLFLKSDSTVWAAGRNDRGQLGDGTNIDKNVPIQILNLSGIKSISAGALYSMFLKYDGTVWGVGDNSNGQLGDGTYTSRNQVVLTQGLNGITKIATGFYHSLFLKFDQTIWGVGGDSFGALGDSTITQTANVIQLTNLPNIIDIKANGLFSMFLSSNGDVWATGNNPSGALADGTFAHKYTPILVPNINNVRSLALGQLLSIFQKNDGTVWGCGDNVGGGLGNGQNLNISIPSQTISLCTLEDNDNSSDLFGVYGEVFLDNNENCIKENEYQATPDIRGVIMPGNITVQTIGNGYWYIDSLPAGNYSIFYDTLSIWKPVCANPLNFTVNNSHEFTVLTPFAFENTSLCSRPNTSIQMPQIRPCFQNQTIYVSSCNENLATAALLNAYTEVELDPNLIFETSSLTATNLGGNKFRFDHGDLNPGECANFTIQVQVNCNVNLGQTLCMETNLYPADSCVFDSIATPNPPDFTPCNLPWDHSSLSVDAICQNDSLYFSVTNNGSDMTCYSPVRLFIDGQYMWLDSVQLLDGEIRVFAFSGDGRTWRLEADQHPLHPGNSHPNATIEACGNSENWTPNLVSILPNNDSEAVRDTYCGVVTGSYDPNDKTGYPLGVGSSHLIQPNGQLDYTIRFQNTGTDTAFTVVVRDTLDTDLNIFSVQSGVSSHNYSFRMYGPRVLEWTFNNILLPDSTINELGSHGFLTFTVNQNPNLADSTQIRNKVGIYFDFNLPIITNTTIHKIGRGIYTGNNKVSQTISLENCNEIEFNSIKYNQSGMYYQLKDGGINLDTLVTLNVQINYPTNSSISESICSSYTAPDNQIYTQSGTYTAVIPNTHGCDSTITINLAIVNPTSSTITESVCSFYTAPDNQIYSATGAYTAIIPNAQGCDSTITINLTVNNFETAITQIDSVLSSTTDNASSFQWINCLNGNQIIPNETNQSFVPSENGEYAVIVTQNNCSDTSACMLVSNVGLQTYIISKVSIFPNPSSKQIVIDFGETISNSELKIYTLAGNLIDYILVSNQNQLEIDIENYAKGMYFLEYKIDSEFKSLKFVKE